MLEHCAAYLIARTEKHSQAMTALAERLGFGVIAPLGSHENMTTQSPMKFFLVYRHIDPVAMRAIMQTIRSSPDNNVRLAPVVLFADECPFDVYLSYIALGFDDVLTLPDKKDALIGRLETQIIGERVYYETDTYLGPDRRRMEVSTHADKRRAGERFSHTRYLVKRSVAAGSTIARTQFFAPSLRTTPPLVGADRLRSAAGGAR